MLEVVHITFEKIGGPFNGTIEGEFILTTGTLDKQMPMVFIGTADGINHFRHGDLIIGLKFLPSQTFEDRYNYIKHFEYGVNFLIKEWSNGGGVRTTDVNKNLN